MSKTWNVYGVVVGTKFLGTFKAETEQEAVVLAEREAHVSLCHQCAREINDPAIEEIRAEEVPE